MFIHEVLLVVAVLIGAAVLAWHLPTKHCERVYIASVFVIGDRCR